MGDLQEALQKYRAAHSAYAKGLELTPPEKLRNALNFYLAMLEMSEFSNPDKGDTFFQLLPINSPEALNLQALQALQARRLDRAIELTGQIIASQAGQEMKGWAFYLAARTWTKLGNEDKRFEALFFAINHARGHGLVDRITRFWEQLKTQPAQQ